MASELSSAPPRAAVPLGAGASPSPAAAPARPPAGRPTPGKPSPALVVANPQARGTRDGTWRALAERMLRRRYVVEVAEPGSERATLDLIAARLAEPEAERPAVVVAAGGDGTVRVVAEALTGSGIPLGVLPLGTGNDFARANGIPDDLKGALERIIRGSTRAIDVVEVNGHRFITAGGIGIGAHTALTVPRLRAAHPLARRAVDSLGTGIYRVSAGANVLLRPGLAERVRITWRAAGESSEQTTELETHGVFIANQGTLGGGLTLPIPADNADGSFDICVVHAVARVRLLSALTRLLAGLSVPRDVFSTWRAASAVIETSRSEAFFGCGELLMEGTRFDVKDVAAGLRVVY